MYDWNSTRSCINTWRLVRQAREAMYRAMEINLSRQQVTIEQIEVLFFIAQYSDGVTVDELSLWCFRRKDSIIRLLKRMENKGFVYRMKQSHPKHVFFHLTNKGEQQLSPYEPAARAPIVQLEQHFSEEELQQLNIYLKGIRDLYLGLLGLQVVSPRKTKT